MFDQLSVKKAQIAPVLKVTFPNYKGHTFKVQFTEKVTFGDLHWGGGTRSVYKFVNMENGSSRPVPTGNPWNSPLEGQTLDLPENVVVVEHVIFCGQDLGIRFYAHPARQRLLTG